MFFSLKSPYGMNCPKNVAAPHHFSPSRFSTEVVLPCAAHSAHEANNSAEIAYLQIFII